MINNRLKLFILATVFIISIPSGVFAQTKINARILPTIWLSSLSVGDGDSIDIHAAIQNNSGIDFNGKASFIIDDKELTKVSFYSSSGSLKDVSTAWVATPGNHSVQVYLVTDLSTSKELVSLNSDRIFINITRKISPEIVKQDFINAVTTVVNKTDILANDLAVKAENLKEPTKTTPTGPVTPKTPNTSKTPNTPTSSKAISNKIVGSSSSPEKTVVGEPISLTAAVYNSGIDVLAFLLRHWVWSVSVLFVIILLFIIFR